MVYEPPVVSVIQVQGWTLADRNGTQPVVALAVHADGDVTPITNSDLASAGVNIHRERYELTPPA